MNTMAQKLIAGGVVEKFHEDGFVHVERLLSPKLTRDVQAELEVLFDAPVEEAVPTNEPMLVCWRHRPDGNRSIFPLSAAPHCQSVLDRTQLLDLCSALAKSDYLQLMEAVVFSKPAGIGEAFAWHNDASFYPVTPVDHISAWIALDTCNEETGALQFAAGSQIYKDIGSVNVKTGERLTNGSAGTELLSDPSALGLEIRRVDMQPGDVVFFSGYTMHCSPPNRSFTSDRRGMSLRFLTQPSRYAPESGKSATFVRQITEAPGEVVTNQCFPVVYQKEES